MLKELIISIIIIVLIIVGNVITQNYTKESIEETSSYLRELREDLIKDEEEIDSDLPKQKLDEIQQKWDIRYEKLAYYIEHNELEKVETGLAGIRGYIDKEEYTEVIPEIDKSIYILEHIKDKNALNLKNIF